MEKDFDSTRESIRQCFLQLLKEKSFNRITIAEIANLTEIHRNTIYYYFKGGTLSILEEIVDQQTDKLIKRSDEIDEPIKLISLVVECLEEQKIHVMHIYDSKGSICLINGIRKISRVYVQSYLLIVLKQRPISTAEEEALTKYLSSSTMGVLIELLNHKLDPCFFEEIQLAGRLIRVALERVLNCIE